MKIPFDNLKFPNSEINYVLLIKTEKKERKTKKELIGS